MQVGRMNYEWYIWLHATDKRPDPPDLKESRLNVGADGIEYE